MRFRKFPAGLHVALFSAILTLVACGGGSMGPKQQVAQNPTSPSSPSSGAPSSGTPAAASTVIDNLDDANAWQTCGACGNDHAAGAVANNSFRTGISSPSQDGGATQFSIFPTVPYSNTYWFQQHNAISVQINHLTYEFDLFIPNGAENAPQAIEFECQQKVGGWIYNFSWQANYSEHVWKIFNYGPAAWESANVPFQTFAPGTWHHIVAEYHTDTATHAVFHDALTVDGVRSAVNIRHDAFLANNDGDQFTNAFQLDTNNRPDTYSVYVDRMKISYN